MNKIDLIYNPHLFQGRDKIKANHPYFEGWYFKITNGKDTISFIPGISIQNNAKSAFVQVITKDSSYFIPYKIEDFKFTDSPFSVSIGNNYFSSSEMNISLTTPDGDILGNIKFKNVQPLKKSMFSPNIMGPFSFLPFMECNHCILDMKNSVNGILSINSNNFVFNNGIGYIEKDWGTSFPSSYLWVQGNCFNNLDNSFFFSYANIPFKAFHFNGFICVFKLQEKEFRFTTYNGSSLKFLSDSHFVLKRGNLKLDVNFEKNNFFDLSAPKLGSMKDTVKESIDSKIYLKFYKNNTLCYSGYSMNSGLECVF